MLAQNFELIKIWSKKLHFQSNQHPRLLWSLCLQNKTKLGLFLSFNVRLLSLHSSRVKVVHVQMFVNHFISIANNAKKTKTGDCFCGMLVGDWGVTHNFLSCFCVQIKQILWYIIKCGFCLEACVRKFKIVKMLSCKWLWS